MKKKMHEPKTVSLKAEGHKAIIIHLECQQFAETTYVIQLRTEICPSFINFVDICTSNILSNNTRTYTYTHAYIQYT